MGRAEIDTGAPFRSVKEAVSLFGEKIIAGGLEEKHERERDKPRLQTLEAELVETKESLKKAIDENNALSRLTKTLSEELETAKKELNALNSTAFLKQPEHPDVEDFKFIEKPRAIKTTRIAQEEEEEDDGFEKKRSVKFASPTSLTRVIANREAETIEKRRLAVTKAKKMKPLVPLAGWIFSRNKSNNR